MRNNFQSVKGHTVYSDDFGDAVYEDGSVFDDTRPCAKCGIAAGPDDVDPCLGWLDGVDSACCGHGVPGEEYVLACGIRYDSVESWRNNQRGTISTTSDQLEVQNERM